MCIEMLSTIQHLIKAQKNDSVVRLGHWAVTGLALFGACAAMLPSPIEGQGLSDPMTEFKQFVSSPPLIDAAVFRVINAADPTRGLPTGEGATYPADRVTYFLARWQTDCFIVKAGANLDVAESSWRPNQEINARFHDDYSRLSPKGVLTTWADPAKTMSETWMEPSHLHEWRVHQFRELMNMGVMDIDVGALKWHGDNFTADGYQTEANLPVQITGKIQAGSNGYAKEIDVQYVTRVGLYNYALRYSYRTNVGMAFLPSTIQSFWLSQGKETKLMECDIFSIRTRVAPMEKSSFVLDTIVATNDMPSILYTNGHYYAKNLVGGWTPIPTRNGDVAGFRRIQAPFNASRYYFGTVIAFSAVAFSLMWRIRNRNTSQIQNVNI